MLACVSDTNPQNRFSEPFVSENCQNIASNVIHSFIHSKLLANENVRFHDYPRIPLNECLRCNYSTTSSSPVFQILRYSLFVTYLPEEPWESSSPRPKHIRANAKEEDDIGYVGSLAVEVKALV